MQLIKDRKLHGQRLSHLFYPWSLLQRLLDSEEYQLLIVSSEDEIVYDNLVFFDSKHFLALKPLMIRTWVKLSGKLFKKLTQIVFFKINVQLFSLLLFFLWANIYHQTSLLFINWIRKKLTPIVDSLAWQLTASRSKPAKYKMYPVIESTIIWLIVLIIVILK